MLRGLCFQPDVYPRKFVHPSTWGGAGGDLSPLRGFGGLIPPGWRVLGLGGSAPEAKNRCKISL